MIIAAILFLIISGLHLIIHVNIYNKNKVNINDFNNLTSRLRKSHITNSDKNQLKIIYKNTYDFFNKQLFKDTTVNNFLYTYQNLDQTIDSWNEEFKIITEITKSYDVYIQKSNSFFDKIDENKKSYFTSKTLDDLLSEFKDTYNYFSNDNFSKTTCPVNDEFTRTYSNLIKLVDEWNKNYVLTELNTYKSFFDNIDGKSLDSQQRVAVVTDDINNLILAGAGSGKTLTIAAKVKYLVECKNIKPEEILLLSFTKKSALEMTTRISEKLHIPLEAKTFHKLGFEILDLKTTDISDELGTIISTYFKENIVNNEGEIQKILLFFLYYLNEPLDLDNFSTLGDYIDTQVSSDLVTLKSKYNLYTMNAKIDEMKKELNTVKGEKVKSMEEVAIANFLFMNGINYEYEREYPFKDENCPNRTYHPDFYLTDYNIYLEHFGVNENNRLPWLSEFEEKKYLESMEWKRAFHKQNNTKLIETYSYYSKDHSLISHLKQLLKENNVELQSVNYCDIYQKVYVDNEDYHFKEFEKLIQTFIQLFKANGYTSTDFDNLLSKTTDTFQIERSKIFIDIVKPIYSFYQKKLYESNKKDYNDMINLATENVKNTGIASKYKYIIIDEYQDISFSRYKLVKSIVEQTNAKLFCVGDDWQSIYRFSGSDLTLFTNFSKYFGKTKILKIEKTYRNSQQLLDIAKKFVEKNPEQLTKNLVSDKKQTDPIMVMMYSQNAKQALHNAFSDIYDNYGKNANVLLLGRTKFDINKYLSTSLIFYSETGKVKYMPFPDMDIKFLTVHSSKGLEADNVILLNLENTLLGFPNKIADDSVLSLVLQNKDNYKYAEERRLFYVAITRTKNKTYLIVPEKKYSVFFKELLNTPKQLPIIANDSENIISDNPTCPKCKRGTLILREKDNRKFICCTNYPYCDYTTSSTEILVTQKKCPVCGGYLVRRKGKHGMFLGCCNYRQYGTSCKYTTKL